MKKFFTFGTLVLCLTGVLSATDLNFSSLSNQATYGLFLNELDAAASPYESSQGPGFSDLKNDYLFGGVVANIEGLNDNSTSNTFVTGYYSAGNSPWSLFAYVDFANADPTVGTEETVVYSSATEKITTSYEIPAYNEIESDIQFLMNFGNINTGLAIELLTDDNRLFSANYSQVSDIAGSAFDNTYEDKNGSTLDYTLRAPFFMESGEKKHSAQLFYKRSREDNSTLSDEKDNTASTYSKTELEDKDITSTFGAWYELTMPLGRGEIRPYILAQKNGKKHDTTTTVDNNGTVTKTEVTRDYEGGFSFAIGSSYYMELNPAGDWLKFRIKPAAEYSRDSEPYETDRETKNTAAGATTTTKRQGAVDKNISSKITVQLDSAMEIRPENWLLGFQMGSRILAAREKEITETENPDVVDAAGVVIEDNDSSNTVDFIDWTSTVNMRYGFFVPLPDDYRMDFTLNANNLFEFENVSVQLIVPLN
ncbi:MAG: hypothetical protein B6241_08200 [Spirochaetaceae bacterium 4572_59]|nr:MAG: hypothetical protein B6241_08200 [Spirochaetaceae bacterium 4572_59]